MVVLSRIWLQTLHEPIFPAHRTKSEPHSRVCAIFPSSYGLIISRSFPPPTAYVQSIIASWNSLLQQNTCFLDPTPASHDFPIYNMTFLHPPWKVFKSFKNQLNLSLGLPVSGWIPTAFRTWPLWLILHLNSCADPVTQHGSHITFT